MSGPSRLDLSDLGITEEQAAKARRLAALSDSDYEWFKRLRLSEEGFSFGDIFEAFFGAEPEITTSRENGSRRRPRGYAEWRPQAKTRRLLAQVEEILEE